jgi:hypothetical protein
LPWYDFTHTVWKRLMRVTLEDNAGRVVRERALRKICELLRGSNMGTDIITKYGTT